MSYENRESGWKNVADFEKEIDKKSNWTLQYSKIYEAGISVINNCEQKIRSDETIPVREVTSWETNKLEILKKAFLIRKDELETEERTLSQDSKWKLIKLLSKQIDEAENETLNRLKLWGSSSEARLLAQEDIENWRHIPMETSDSGLITLKSWAENFHMKNLKFLFSDYSYTEHYDNWLWIRTNETTSRTVNNKSKKYFVDFSNCSETDLKKIKEHLHILDEIVVTAKRPDGTPYRETINNYSIDKIRWRISYDQVTHWLKWEWEDNSIYKRDSEVTPDLILGMPLCKWATIQEEWAMKANASVNLNEVRRDNDELYFWKLNLDNYSENPEENPELKKYTSFFDNFDNNKLRLALKNLWNEEYNNFILATENRVREIIQWQRALWYTLRTPPVTNGWGLMTVNFWDDKLKPCKVSMWSNKNTCPLGADLYDMIEDKYEDEYNAYLTNSVKSKFEETSYLTVSEQLLKKTFDDLNDQDICLFSEKEWILRWLGLLNELTIDMANISDNNENCERCLRFLEDLIYTVSNTQCVSRSELKWLVNEKMVNYYREIHSWISIIDDSRWAWKYYLWDLIFGDKDKQESAYRGISGMFDHEIWQWQRTRFVTATNEDWERELSVENQELNNCLKNIDNYFGIKDGDINYKSDWENISLIMNNKLQTIDKLYVFAGYPPDEGYNKIRDYLTKLNIIPEKYQYKNEIREACKRIYKNLRNQSIMVERKMPSENELKQKFADRKTHLELLKSDWKINDTEDKELEMLKYYIEHPNEMGFVIEKTLKWLKAQIKFDWINDLVRNSLFPVYWDLSWWTTGGESSRMYNDSMWYWWWFNLSDENNRILKMVAEDVVITALTLPIWWAAATWISALRTACLAWKLWVAWSRILRMEKRLHALTRLISIRTKSKFWAIWAKIWMEAAWREAWWFVVEWWWNFVENITQNAFTTMHNNIWHWNWPFDGLNLDIAISSSLKDLTAFWFACWAKKIFNTNGWKSLNLDLNFLNKELPGYIKWPSKELWKKIFKEIVGQPVVNLVLWHKTFDSDTWIESSTHELVRDDRLVWNLMATVLSQANNSSTWKKISSKLSDGTYKILFDKDKKEFFAKNQLTNEKPISLSHLENLVVA